MDFHCALIITAQENNFDHASLYSMHVMAYEIVYSLQALLISAALQYLLSFC